MEMLFKHGWLFFIIATVYNAYLLKSSLKNYILDKPEREEGYNKIIKAIVIYGNIPWVIIAIGNLSGLTNSIFDYFRPKEMNPIVLLFHAVIFLFWVLSIWWIYFKGGVSFLQNHPGILKKKAFFSGRTDMTAEEIKTMLPLMLLGGIVGMLMMWVIDIPVLK